MNNRNLALGGAALLAAGLFTPIVKMPIVGSVSLFGNGTNLIAIDLLLLAIIAVTLAAKDRLHDILWPGIAASAVLLYEFVSLEYRLSQMKETLSKELQGNPFSGLAQGAMSAVQIEWGWLILAAGAALLVYAAVTAPRDEDAPRFQFPDQASKIIAGVSLLLLLFAPVWDLVGKSRGITELSNSTSSTVDANKTNPTAPTTSSDAPSAEEAAYIKQSLRLYDLRSKYYDSMFDGRVAGVDFKIQNNGNRALNKVTVRVVFYDSNGNPISEQEYNPVLVTDFSVDDNTPLRPHYIWQQESEKFYQAKNVPNEWAEGKATATITEIEFGPN